MGAALHGLVQMWDEPRQGWGRSRRALKGWMWCLCWVLATGQHCMDHGLRAFTTLHFSLLQSHPSQTACGGAGGHQLCAGEGVTPGCSEPFPRSQGWGMVWSTWVWPCQGCRHRGGTAGP